MNLWWPQRVSWLVTLAIAVAGCRDGDSPSSDRMVDVQVVTAPEMLGRLDVGGRLVNRLVLTPGDTWTSGLLEFDPSAVGDRSGVLVWTETRVSGGDCDSDAVTSRVTLRSMNGSGPAGRVVDWMPMYPIPVADGQRVEIIVAAKTDRPCYGASVTIAVRYFADAVRGTPTAGPDGGSEVRSPIEHPARTCIETPTSKLALGSLSFHGSATQSSACREQYEWTVGRQLMRDGAGCLLGEPTTTLTEDGGSTVLKIIQHADDVEFNLAWITLPRDATSVRDTLDDGGRVTMTPVDHCPALNEAPTVRTDSPWSTIIFRGDPRSACVGDGSIARNPRPATPADVRVEYRYDDASSAHWEFALALDAASEAMLTPVSDSLAFRLFNRKTMGMATDWRPVSRAGDRWVGRIDGGDLASVLPYQEDLEILLADAAVLPCSVALALPFYEWVLSPDFRSSFVDLTGPGTAPDRLPDPPFTDGEP